MAFPSGFLDELRARLTLSAVVGRRVRLVRAGREFKACCPFHKEKSASFTVNDQKGFFHCFGCGAHGDVVGFTMRQENRSFMEAVEVLAAEAGLAMPSTSPQERQRYETEKTLHQAIEEAALWFTAQLHHASGREALDYARQRGLNALMLAQHRLGFAPQDGSLLISHLLGKGYTADQLVAAGLAKKGEKDGRLYSFFRNRLLFPVADKRGRVVAFGGRLLEGEGPKYINSPDHSLFHKGQLLYGFSRARAAAGDGKPLIITEGYMDVIRLVEAGFTGAVAPLGTALTEDQLLALWQIIPRPPVRPDLLNHIPVLCFDGDAAGARAAERALQRILPHLAADQSVRFAAMPAGEDPDSLIKAKGAGAMQQLLDKAMPCIDFLWQSVAASRPLNTPEDRAGFRRDLETHIATIHDSSVQRDYRQAVQKKQEELFGGAKAYVGYKPAAYSGAYNNKKQPPWKNRFMPPLPIIQPRPMPSNIQERIVLALLINHPALFPEMEEAIQNLPLADASLHPLRQAVFDYMTEDNFDHANGDHDNGADATLLRAHLEKAGFAKMLATALGPALYIHARFARPGAALEAARAGWQNLWQQHTRRQLEEELKAMSLELGNPDSAQVLERIDHLKAMLAEVLAAIDANAEQMTEDR